MKECAEEKVKQEDGEKKEEINWPRYILLKEYEEIVKPEVSN